MMHPLELAIIDVATKLSDPVTGGGTVTLSQPAEDLKRILAMPTEIRDELLDEIVAKAATS